MTNWAAVAPWASALSRWPARLVVYPEPAGAVMAAMLSSQTPVGWLEIRLPPDSEFAFAAQSGFTYIFAPLYALSTCGQLVQLTCDGVGDALLRLGDALGDVERLGDALGDVLRLGEEVGEV